MLYELVEEAKDSLTDNNIPCGDCVICLYPFRVSMFVPLARQH